MDPKELVGATVYLASPSASSTTGHLLIVDGGWTAL
jgi:2-deoxy-D-gluconate 3-dehydrogenase